jgi:hypothetical protein
MFNSGEGVPLVAEKRVPHIRPVRADRPPEARTLDTRRFAGCLFVMGAEATRYGSPAGLSRAGSA